MNMKIENPSSSFNNMPINNNLASTVGNNNSNFMNVTDSRMYKSDSTVFKPENINYSRQITNDDVFRVNSAGKTNN